MGSAPVGAQCPLTSSLGEFLGYRDWLWYPGHSPVLVSIALPFAFHISVFSIHSSSPAIGFHSSIFYGGGICTPYSRLGTGTMVIEYPKRLRYPGGGVNVMRMDIGSQNMPNEIIISNVGLMHIDIIISLGIF